MKSLNKEFNWLLSHPEVEEKYSGEYIAIVGNRIVAHGKNCKKVLDAALKGKGKPLFHKVSPTNKLLVI